jgi:hypothetical protein
MRVDRATGWLVFKTAEHADTYIIKLLKKVDRPNYYITYDARVSGYVVRAVTDSGEGEGETI